MSLRVSVVDLCSPSIGTSGSDLLSSLICLLNLIPFPQSPYQLCAYTYSHPQFSPNGTLQFGQSVKGRDAIKSFRAAMVDPTNGPVVDLQHTLGKCFMLAGSPSDSNTQEVIVNGSIWYRLKNGRKVDCDFSSWMVFSEQDGQMLADYYEVYLDAFELMTAIGEMNAKEGK